jgi:hypothetical protein
VALPASNAQASPRKDGKKMNESLKIRTDAAKYAKAFLVSKYRKEYQELYDAYITNRGLEPRRSKQNIVDERLVTNE